MKHTGSLFAGLVLGLMLAPLPAGAQSTARSPHVSISLIPEKLDLAPGGSTRVAIRFEIEPGWHLYFAYPGQSGIGTQFKWQLPAGVTIDSLEWPVPERLVTEGLVTQVYQGNFTLATTLHVSPTNPETHLSVAVNWGICRIQCVADDVLLRLTIKAGTGHPNPAWKTVAPELAKLAGTIPGLSVAAVRQGAAIALVLHPAGALPPGGHKLTFFPLDGSALDTCVTATPKVSGADATLALGPVSPTAKRLRGILAGWPAGNSPGGLVVDVGIGK